MNSKVFFTTEKFNLMWWWQLASRTRFGPNHFTHAQEIWHREWTLWCSKEVRQTRLGSTSTAHRSATTFSFRLGLKRGLCLQAPALQNNPRIETNEGEPISSRKEESSRTQGGKNVPSDSERSDGFRILRDYHLKYLKNQIKCRGLRFCHLCWERGQSINYWTLSYRQNHHDYLSPSQIFEVRILQLQPTWTESRFSDL